VGQKGVRCEVRGRDPAEVRGNRGRRAAVLILSPDMRNARRFNKLPGLMKHVRVIHGRLIESYLYNRG
jgi:hypothetical protein